jgi:uncharacterized damage-inducible protein DinB
MNAGDILKYGQGTALQAVEGLSADAWETSGVCGIWSVKEIIAHLASYELVLGDVLSGFTGGGPTPHLDAFKDFGAFNDAQVALRQEKTAQAVLAEFAEAHARVRSHADRIPTETFRTPGTLPWYGAEYALDDFIVYAFYGHKREHAAQIAAFRDRLGNT